MTIEKLHCGTEDNHAPHTWHHEIDGSEFACAGSHIAFGYATQTAANQHFLNTCDAVKEWKEHTNHEGAEYFVFSYDVMIEVSLVPEDVNFAYCDSWEAARGETR